MSRHAWRLLLSLGVLAGIVALWWTASHREWLSKVFLPTPEAAFEALADGLLADMAPQLRQTVGRMIQGWLLACLAGIAMGAVIGVSPRLRPWLQPSLEFLRPLPASAVLPVAISIFGLSPAMVLSVVAFGAVWPVLLGTIHGFATIEPRLGEVARCLGLSRAGFILKMGLPNALADILAGMRLSLTVALILAVVGEMMASQEGLGQAILLAARSFRSSDLFAGIILLGAVGFASNAMLALAERRMLRWQSLNTD